MYSGTLKIPFRPDESKFRHAEKRKEYSDQLRAHTPAASANAEPYPLRRSRTPSFSFPEKEGGRSRFAPPPPAPPPHAPPPKSGKEGGIALLDGIGIEDSALIALIVFLLCDHTDTDLVLLAILLYLLLTK